MDAMTMLSVAGSSFSTIATGYFWLVRNRRERPHLRPHLADREMFLSNGGADQRGVGLKLGLIVANYSLLPNALLGVNLAAATRAGGWLAVENVAFDKQTPLPFNLPSMQTVMLRLNGYLHFPTRPELEEGKVLGNYVNHYLTDPRQMRVTLIGLNGYTHTHTLKWPAVAA